MTDTPISVLEARLEAQRRLLARIVAALAPEARQPVIDWLDQHDTLRDGQEDPGAVPTEDTGAALAVSEEFRMIARLVGDRLHEVDQA
ncbi:hypothetical protein E4L95_16320 [Paracoccus liaowanqingii]|uniref:Uncharacterized protein n=1 Tax=Paracoccus liaowanqingii TaxID=2560053 RepID=A0A4Z1C8Q7_9RHOB|nr:hypothetical protein [Paracoccus liaowanqingii]QDA36585.1 hypothetical protein E4191_21025 [Paracoccus liaowanqingii]TGN52288.1 hypothetical protein E4L95_16320 [Paracoccus liaowanqingii]